jgi:hypothetical protein
VSPFQSCIAALKVVVNSRFGPGDDASDAVTNVGVAVHITAAASVYGVRRYDPSLTVQERCGVDNGIWLCSTCSIPIDRDEAVFSIEALRTIRRDRTDFARLVAQ